MTIMNPVNSVGQLLNIPRHYTHHIGTDDRRIVVLVHTTWLRNLLSSNAVPTFIAHEHLSHEEVEAALLQQREFSPSWQRVLLQIIPKPPEESLALALQRSSTSNHREEASLSYPELLHYVSYTNYRNSWKSNYKTYLGPTQQRRKKSKGFPSKKSLLVLKEVISRFYGCPILDLSGDDPAPGSIDFQSHINVLPALCAVETADDIILLHPLTDVVTLEEYATFSPSVFSANYSKPLFIIYQLLQALKDSHDRALILGDIRLSDIFISPNLFIQVIPSVASNLISISDEDAVPTNIPRSPVDNSLASLCLRWSCGDLSNYEYLLHLNAASGRRFGNPACHFVFPWVSDLSTRSSGPWRDLSRSKFRLNKGDCQLDITFDSASTNQIPHHVSDVLSEITYYVYLSRRTPRSVLCRYVRSSWVPAEYPSSIQRLQAWTPDECIPEFFSDPAIFKSIHEDLADLEVPAWAQTPEEFISSHREQLESRRVSDKLHHWIDLTFGYKLTGPAAVKAKNVCLHLACDQKNLSTSGVVQVFRHPHPKRQTPLPYFDKHPPKPRKPPVTHEDDLGISSDNEDDENADLKTTSLQLHRLFSVSRNSLLAPFLSSSEETGQKSSGASTASTAGTSGGLALPTEHNPLSLLNAVESLHGFHWKTFGKAPPGSKPTTLKAGPKEEAARKRTQEMQILGCIIMEIFIGNHLRVLPIKTVEERIETCLAHSTNDDIPHCVRPAINLLLNKCPPISNIGLPPPSAHQILQPLLSSFIIPFPPFMPPLYASVSRLRTLRACEGAVDFLPRLFAKDLDSILDEQSIDILFPFVKELLLNPQTTYLTVTLFLDKILRFLGMARTNELLLDTFLSLYDRSPVDCFVYQRRFLLMLMVRCGLKEFLNHFMVLIIEAVGRMGSHSVIESEICEDEEVSPEIDEKQVDKGHGPEIEVFMFDREDTPSDGESLQNLMDHLTGTSDDEDADVSSECDKNLNVVRSPPIPVASHGIWSDKIPSVDCEVGSKSCETDNGHQEIQTYDEMASMGAHITENVADVSKAHEIAADSVLWLSRRFGPTLTAKHISRNLLKMLNLCYTGSAALAPALMCADGSDVWRHSVSQRKVIGDDNASSVLKCLSQLVQLYGEQFILVQYLPFMRELIAISKRKMTFSVEGGAIGSLVLLQHIAPLLSDSTLMDNLQDMFLKSVLHPLVRLMVSIRHPFPSGFAGRLCLATKLLDTLYSLSLHIGAEMTRVHLAVPSLQRFFLAFDKAADVRPGVGEVENGESLETTPSNMFVELKRVFNPELAHTAYLAFFRLLGKQTMENALTNHETIRKLCVQYEHQMDPAASRKMRTMNQTYLSDFLATGDNIVEMGGSGSFGSNVAVVGNKIELYGTDCMDVNRPNNLTGGFAQKVSKDSTRHLRGNWLAYWEHEIGRSEKDSRFNFKQIKLQSFSGHSNAVRTLMVLDNENSFVSGSRDKTVRLWSLRSQGDGTATCPSQFTYSGHRKSILATAFLSGPRLLASCDSTIHLWDPFTGQTAAILDSGRSAPFSILRAIPGPGFTFMAGTTESTIRHIDSRMANHVSEFKIAWSQAGLIRSMCVSNDATWIAVGQSTGFLTVLDLRTGLVIAAWRGHEGEILQLASVNRDTLLSSSLDHTVSVWNINDGKLKFHMKGSPEPVHCLQTHGSELITATTANRIGVHTGIDCQAGFSSVKLRSDTFKGVLTSMAVLPLNMQLLVGADNGLITLLC